MKNNYRFEEALKIVDRLSLVEKARLIEEIAIQLEQGLASQNLKPRKSLKILWKDPKVTNGLILSAKYLNKIAHLKPDNARVFSQIEAATNNLFYYSQNEYPFETFVWKTDKQGEFNVVSFLQDNGFIRNISIDEYLNSIEPEDINYVELKEIILTEEKIEIFNKIQGAQKQLLELLRSEAKQLEIFRFELWDDDIIYDSVDFVVAQTIDEEWIAVSPILNCIPRYLHYGDYNWKYGKIIYKPDLKDVKTSTLELKSKIDLILKNTNFSIKQSYCQELADNLVFEIGENENSLIAELLHHTCLIKTTTFEKFSEYHNDGSRTDKEMSQYQNLDRLLEENLNNIQEYTIGVGSIYYLYVIGETSKGDYLGVSTIYTNT